METNLLLKASREMPQTDPQSIHCRATALFNQGAISYMSKEAFGVVERSGLGDVEPRGLGAGR